MIKNNLQKRSLLWKVSGKNLVRPSYIFGTMHLMCAKDFFIKEKVTKAFSKCQSLVMEVDLASMAEMEIMNSSQASCNSISEGLDENEQAELDTILQSEYGYSLAEADRQAPIVLLNQMIVKAIGCEEMKIFEMEFITLAREHQMETGGLETAQQQLDIAENIYTSKELLRQLKAGDDYKDVFQKMVRAYQNENLAILNTLISDRRFISDSGEQELLIARNKNWAVTLPRFMKKNSTFFAVGAGHLGGEKGILYLLQKKGYNVNPVYR